MSNKSFLILLALLTLISYPLFAAGDIWEDEVGNWTEASKWSNGILPDGLERIVISSVDFDKDSSICTVNTNVGDVSGPGNETLFYIEENAQFIVGDGGDISVGELRMDQDWRHGRFEEGHFPRYIQTGGNMTIKDAAKLAIFDRTGYCICPPISFEVSGGTLNVISPAYIFLPYASNTSGEMIVSGSNATINVHKLQLGWGWNSVGIITFELDSGGVTPINCTQFFADKNVEFSTTELNIVAIDNPPEADITLFTYTNDTPGLFDIVNGQTAVDGMNVMVEYDLVQYNYTLVAEEPNEMKLSYESKNPAPPISVQAGDSLVFDTDKLKCTLNSNRIGSTSVGPTGDAIFAFNDLDIADGASVAVTGSSPLVISSAGNIDLNSVIDISAPDPNGLNQDDAPGGPAGGYAGGGYRSSGSGPGGGIWPDVYRTYGAGYGGKGGLSGYDPDPLLQSQTYGNEEITVLHGGSGGAGGTYDDSDRGYDSAVGGGGGGAVALMAEGNITIGSNAKILSEGGSVKAWVYRHNGSGGSGGSIRIQAKGTITHNGVISANGGEGGHIYEEIETDTSPQLRTGAGGGGGRVAFYSTSGTINGSGTITVTGGQAGTMHPADPPTANSHLYVGTGDATAGEDGTIYYGTDFIPPAATIDEFDPADNEKSVMVSTNLDFDALDTYFSSYDVYFSDSYDEVNNETVAPVNVTTSMVNNTNLPVLLKGAVYYWKVVGHLYDGGDVASNILSFTTECTKQSAADINEDCQITIIDFGLLAENWMDCNRYPLSDCP